MNCNVLVKFSKKIFGYAILASAAVFFGQLSVAMADEPGPGAVYPHKKMAPRPVAEAPKMEQAPVRAAEPMEEGCEWGVRVAGGVPVWFFDDESNLPGAGAYVDVFNNDRRINLRLGVEGRHMYLSQDAAASAAEWSDKTTRITYMRIPLSVEYIVPLQMEGTQLFLGGGPDLVHTANDIESTEVGGHLSARMLYDFYENWGVAVEGGYMWGNAHRSGKDVNLDGAYITPTLNYTF